MCRAAVVLERQAEVEPTTHHLIPIYRPEGAPLGRRESCMVGESTRRPLGRCERTPRESELRELGRCYGLSSFFSFIVRRSARLRQARRGAHRELPGTSSIFVLVHPRPPSHVGPRRSPIHGPGGCPCRRILDQLAASTHTLSQPAAWTRDRLADGTAPA